MKKLIVILCAMFLSFPIVTKAVATNSSEYDAIVVNVLYDDNKEVKELKEYLDDYKKEIDIKKDKDPLTIIGSNYFIGFNDKVKTSIGNAI